MSEINATSYQECVACGQPCPPDRRWCSTACLYAEDGYPHPDTDDQEEDEE